MPFDLKTKNSRRKTGDIEEYEEMSVSYSEETNYDGTLYQWSAPEHEPYTVGSRFYILSAIFLLAIIIYALVYNSPIMAITFILIGIVGYVFLQKDPDIVNFSITPEGIIAGREIYEFDNLKSFWIFYDPPQEKVISLHSKNTFTPFIHIPIADEDPVEIRRILVDFIPEIKQEHSLVDAAERLLHR
jgi:uncharacterized membrane protein